MAGLLRQKSDGEVVRQDGTTFVGCWQLLRVPTGRPFTHALANAHVGGVLLPRLFRGIAYHSTAYGLAYHSTA